MNDIRITQTDLSDDALLRAWWECGRAAATDRIVDDYPAFETSRELLRRRHPDMDAYRLVAHDGEGLVGIASLVIPQKDNLNVAVVYLNVPVAQRRRGIGSALLTELEEHAADLGRVTLHSQAFAPPDEHSAGELFALSRGYAVALRAGLKVLRLADHIPAWDALDAKVAGRIGDHRIITWADDAPEELLVELSAAVSRFNTMMPLDDLELEDAQMTPERWREIEAHQQASGDRVFAAAAVTSAGGVVGHSELFVADADPARASQGNTMVLPEHRGHSLGLAMKLATHRAMMVAFPQCRTVHTGNADVNQHMNAVNEEMGYRRLEDMLGLQKHLG